jgi:hypothetical protein
MIISLTSWIEASTLSWDVIKPEKISVRVGEEKKLMAGSRRSFRNEGNGRRDEVEI